MAHPTAEQADVMRQLRAEYGTPTSAKIERTDAPYGTIWCLWTADLGPVRGFDRNLFIKPDGTRLAWERLRQIGQ